MDKPDVRALVEDVPADVWALARLTAGDIFFPDLVPEEDIRRIADAIMADRATRETAKADSVEAAYIDIQAKYLAATKEIGEARVAVEWAKAEGRREGLEEAAKVAEAWYDAPSPFGTQHGAGVDYAARAIAKDVRAIAADIRALAKAEGKDG